jgi:hypothetical protein
MHAETLLSRTHRFPVLCALVLSMQSVMAQLVTDTVCVKAPSGANKSSKS